MTMQELTRGHDAGRTCCVLAAGARTALGQDLASSAAAARAAISEFADHPFMIDQTGGPMVVARDPGLPLELQGGERLAHLVASVAVECIDALGLQPGAQPLPLCLFLASPEARRAPRDWKASRFVATVQEALGMRAEVRGTSMIELGHAAGVEAVRAAVQAVRAGLDGCALVIGVDSWLDPASLEWLDATERLHSPSCAFGFVPGEAAAGVLLGPAHLAGEARPRAWIDGCGLSLEADLAPDSPRLGRALTRAVQEALAGTVGADRAAVKTVFADLNGIAERADEMGYTMVRVSDRMLPGYETVTPAETFGDVGAATLPLMLALAVAGVEKGYREGPMLMLAQSIGAERGAVVISFPQKEGGGSW